MKTFVKLIVIAVMMSACMTDPRVPEQTFEYPKTTRQDVVDDYHGTKVKDPYRWLENDTSKQTEAWVQAQNRVTFDYLKTIPYREKIRKRYEELFNYEKVSSPRKVGEYYFFNKNDGLQNQSVIYYKKGMDAEANVFIDPNKMSDEGTVAVNLLGNSKDNKYIAYSVSEAGSDWQTIKVREIETNKVLGDELEWVKFSGASWYKDGFFYSRYPEPEEGLEHSATNKNHSIYYHKLGTEQADDQLIYRDEDHPLMYHYGGLTEDKQYFVMYVAQGTDGYECYYKDLSQGLMAPFKNLFKGFKNKSSVVDHRDGYFYVHTNIDAPNFRLVKIDLANPGKANWKEIIPENEHLLEGVNTAGNKLFANYLQNASTHIYQYSYSGEMEHQVDLPGVGSAGGFDGKKEDEEVFYYYTSFNYPTTIFKYNIPAKTSAVFFQPELEFNPEDFTSKQVFYKSKDGTEVPMFIVHKKGLEMDGNNPTMLYGYGGFNVTMSPHFSTSNIILLENGGIYALANIRGGGEFGEDWHKAGMLKNKQNVFDDFIAAAEYLIENKYTSSNKLAIKGGSNGGLLVGACMTQRPELFEVAIPQVGVMDMLRYNRFTVGWGWVPEYGAADSSKAMFEYLYGYSPLHNMVETDYPATLITTADHDDRVVPAHSFKFAAALQDHHTGKDPVMIRIETSAGHGAGKPTSKVIEEQADIWSFMFWNMEIKSLYENIETEKEES